jgi:hypothetical protein
MRRAFIAALTSEKLWMPIKNILFRICKSLYDVKSKAQSEWCAPYCAFAHWVPNGQLLYEMAPEL